MRENVHPIVAQLSPNEEQLPAICARGCDVVVTAGAGTGKTRTLVARYLSLLAEGRPLRGIVAITFTRKAAREMRNRVRAEVQRYVTRSELTRLQREHWQSVYAGLDAARIGTIHSLCGEILRAHPAEAGIDPLFQVLEEGQAALLRRDAVNAALTWAADEPDVVGLFALLNGPEGLRAVVATLLEHPNDTAAAFDAVPSHPLGHWRDLVRRNQKHVLGRLLASPDWRQAVVALRQSHPRDPDDAMAVQRRLALDALDDAAMLGEGASPETNGSDVQETHSLRRRLDVLSRLDDISLSGGSYKAWAGGSEEKDMIKAALKTLRHLWRENADLLSMSLTATDEKLAKALPQLRLTFEFAWRQYRGTKRETRALDFDDLESEAIELLQRHREVRLRWQEQVEAILVDEFQDTNQRQRDLVCLLAGDAGSPQSPGYEESAGKLFIVGDAKQSIYGFRGADVTVFRAERDRIVTRGGQGWPLATSYRAHRGLVQGLNDLLRPVLGETADPARPWAEPFAPIHPHRETPETGVEAPYIEFHLAVGSKSGGALDRAARAVVARVVELMETSGREAKGEDEPLGCGDVAILCRASTSFGAYENALDAASVPYLTVAGRGFYDRPEIRDLLNALLALSDPKDDLALLGLLRSPALALTDALLYKIMQTRQDSSVPLWDTLNQKVSQGEALPLPAVRAVFLIAMLHKAAGRTQIADLLKGFLDATNYRAALLRAGRERAVRNVDKLLADAHASGMAGIGAFLSYIQEVRDSGAREGEARAVAGEAIQIMSVHQAKGLEFPIVVLGDASWGGGGGGGAVLTDTVHGVLLPIKDQETDELAAVYRLARARQADQGSAEEDRLLYVAATRAREELLVSGTLGGIKKNGTPYKLSGWLRQLGRPLGLHELEVAYDDEGATLHHWDLQVDGTHADCFIYEPNHALHASQDRRVCSDAPVDPIPLPPPLLAPVAEQLLPSIERKRCTVIRRAVPERETTTAPAWIVGKLVHEALAGWNLPQNRNDPGFRRWLHARARAAGLVTEGSIAHALRRAIRVLLRFQEHPLFEEIAGAERRLHELPYALAGNDGPETGKLDLLYRSQGMWTIVEFKTDEVSSEMDFRDLLRREDYEAQVRRYAGAAETLLGSRPRCLLWMLDFRGESRVFSVLPDGPPTLAEGLQVR